MTDGASGGKPKAVKELATTCAKPACVTIIVGIPIFSIRAAARPHAVAQEPQPALPTMAASPPFSFTRAPIPSVSICRLP